MLLSRAALAELELKIGRKPISALTYDDIDIAYRPLIPEALRGQGARHGEVATWVLNAFTRDRLERDLGRPLPVKMSDASARTYMAIREELEANGPQMLTNLTEMVWGTSGRGNKTLVELIRAFALFNLLRIEKRGRAQVVSIP